MSDTVLQYTVHDPKTGERHLRGTTPPEPLAAFLREHNPRALGAPLPAAVTAGALTVTTAPPVPAPEVPQAPAEDGAPVLYPEGLPDDSWTVKDLRAWAKDNDLTLGEAKAKPQILEVIAEHLGARAEDLHTDPADPGDDETTPTAE